MRFCFFQWYRNGLVWNRIIVFKISRHIQELLKWHSFFSAKKQPSVEEINMFYKIGLLYKAYNFIKKRLQHSIFLWNLQNFKEQLFYRTTPVAASVCWQNEYHQKFNVWVLLQLNALLTQQKKRTFALKVSQQIWPNPEESRDLVNLLKKSLMENLIFFTVYKFFTVSKIM